MDNENRPRLAKIEGGGAAFLHPCGVCGKPYAPFGFSVSLRGGRPGYWRCAAHRNVEPQTVTTPEVKAKPVERPPAPEPEGTPKMNKEEQGSLF